jgi:hypothetical protein
MIAEGSFGMAESHASFSSILPHKMNILMHRVSRSGVNNHWQLIDQFLVSILV